MKKKLVLDFDQLKVESFATLEAGDGRGTVFANASEEDTCATCLDCSAASLCVCDPETTIQCGGGTDATWYYSCQASYYTCEPNYCPSNYSDCCPTRVPANC